jgi:hypothetical protein
MLTTDQILAVVNGLGKAGTSGRTQALRRANRDPMGRSSLTQAQQAFLDAADDVPARQAVKYVHPGAVAPPVTGRSRGDAPLSPSELAWLDRLPRDPAQVPFSDAQRLLSLADAVKRPDDRTLLRSIAAPVQEHHDLNQALSNLSNVSTPPPAAPHETLGALADAIAATNQHLEPDEAVGRASELLRENGERRLRDHSLSVQQAQRHVDAVTTAASDRTAVTR